MKAIKEAEAYPGPSLIIAYAPCINHGLKASMGKSQQEEKKAVECGYWQLYRYNPMLEIEGKNPFQLDSKEPDYTKFREFLMGEVRFNSLMKATPEAQLILVMDPVGGDKIKANGTGNLRMDYGSANEDLRMYGKYTLDKGSYNFTLQDIIIKDFIIKQGSTISFNGDPYAAQLDLNAYYALNANLSDLDESFLQDKDLNRTNVPVHAMMNVTSDIRSPKIKFDLEFPTLTSDDSSYLQ